MSALDIDDRQGSPQRPLSAFLVQSIRLEESDPGGISRTIVLVIAALIAAALAWCAITPVDELARMPGSVVPDGSVQVVQHLEGGIVAEIAVRDGDLVEAGQILLRLAPESPQAELAQIHARRVSLLLTEERLRAFADGRQPDWTGRGGDAQLIAEQAELFEAQVASAELQLAQLDQQLAVQLSEADRFASQMALLEQEVALAREGDQIAGDLSARGLARRTEALSARREVTRLDRELADAGGLLASAELRISELEGQQVELWARLRSEALAEAGALAGELAEVEERLLALTDRVERLDVRAPVRGLVKGLTVNTVNSVVQPGEVVMEIVPLGQALVVEAQLSPRDAGFVAVGQEADIRVSSYDFARFGSVAGTVAEVSPTTFLDDNQQPYYRVIVELDRNHVGDDPSKTIIPGMVVEADVRTGSKTVLEYLLRPVSQGLSDAFRER